MTQTSTKSQGPAVSVLPGADPATLLVAGSVSFSNVVKLRNHGKQLLQQSTQPQLTFDLQKVEDSDNSGLVLLVAWMQDAKHVNKTILFRHVPDFLQRMAQVFGLHSMLFNKIQ
jgi:ABC-type transporter Mla MlaB component